MAWNVDPKDPGRMVRNTTHKEEVDVRTLKLDIRALNKRLEEVQGKIDAKQALLSEAEAAGCDMTAGDDEIAKLDEEEEG